jgi:hypothetical protein
MKTKRLSLMGFSLMEKHSILRKLEWGNEKKKKKTLTDLLCRIDEQSM